jgi:hypothetical protein
MKGSRQVFNYDNLNESKIVENTNDMFKNSITACGCLIYKTRNKKVELLLNKYDDVNWSKLDDFGGKISLNDKDIFQAAVRKTASETNNIINDEEIADLISDNTCTTFYNKRSKYFMYLIEVNENYICDTSLFGDADETENIKRTIKWYEYDKIKCKLAYRLSQNDKLCAYFNSIQS